ncbi:MAG: FKBP-type peptidyl-prolyl cis-trans isomerase [Candidatus Melainabacteria bacterium]|nr:FKBP-type peptidyl-prolyl cis-trans isomerase [Candidatus Melainabacteria bacterium]
MKPIHKLRLLAIGAVFALLCYLAYAFVFKSFAISLTGGLALVVLGALAAAVVLDLGISAFLNRHSGKASTKTAPQWLSQHTLKNGVQVLVSKIGSGRSVRRGRRIVLEYSAYHTVVRRATLFDTTAGRAPLELTFGAKHRLGAWTEGLEFLKDGAKVRLIIPPAVGFGWNGKGPLVPPNATLIFDVEVVQVKYND